MPTRLASLPIALFTLLILVAMPAAARAQATATPPAEATDAETPDVRAHADVAPVLVIHGGAGTIRREAMSPGREAAYRNALRAALEAGYAALQRGDAAVDAIRVSLRMMENSPLFNAGRGAVLTNAGTAELDASIMDGRDRSAGAVAGSRRVRNPIDLAHAVMTASPHVMLAGDGADTFAEEQGLTMVDPSYFVTPVRQGQLHRMQERERAGTGDARGTAGDEPLWSDPVEQKLGTVGAVARDRAGHLAAGTTTGGMMNKRWGRVGDSPVIGAGTYADDATCAVSATGHGEYFIRGVVAYDVAALVRYAGLSCPEAAERVIHEHLEALGGTGGVIVLGADGAYATPFNTEGMYRGWVDADGQITIAIYGDEAEEQDDQDD